MHLGELSVRMFNQERTIVDSFRLLSKEVAIKALKRYLVAKETHRPDLGKLHHYAKQLRTNIIPYIEAFTT